MKQFYKINLTLFLIIVSSIIYAQNYTNWQFSNYTVGYHPGNEFSGSSIMMPEVMLTDSNNYRMFYNVNNGEDSCSYIKYAESNDGISWSVKGIALDGINDTLDPNFWSGGARIVQLNNGNYRMFYRTTKYVGNGQPLYHIKSAISIDGKYFVRETGVRINIYEYDITSSFQTAAHGEFFKNDSGTFIAIFSASLITDPIYGEPSDLYIATSFDEGITWSSFVKLYEDCHDPVVVKKDSMYYLFAALEDYAFVTAQSSDGIIWPSTLDTLYFTDSLNTDLTDTISDLGAVVNMNNEIEMYSNYGVPSENIGRFLSTNPLITSNSQAINWIPYRTLDPTDGTNFLIDSTGILPSLSDYGVPALNLCADSVIQIGFSSSNTFDRAVAISTDSFASWSIYNGSNPADDIDGDFIYLADGSIRFIVAELYNFKSRMVSYLSTDGYNWIAESGVCYQPDALEDSLVGVPTVIQLQDSLWRMYYVADMLEVGSGIGNGNGIRTALSTDWGQSWKKEVTSNLLPGGNVDPHIMYLSNGGYRLYFRSASLSGIAFVDSPDGLTFDFSKSVLVVKDNLFGTNNLFYDPYIYKLPTNKVYIFMGSTGKNGNTNSRVVMGVDDSNISSIINITKNDIIALYPNPATDYLNISVNGAKILSNTCKIYNSKGDVVLEKLINSNSIISIPIGNLASGVYFIEVNNKRIPFIKKK